MSRFVPRLTQPEAGNPYYNSISSGGYSLAIRGNPSQAGLDVLANCVGYAYGRFNEIGGYGSCRYLKPVNAENFIEYAGGLEVTQQPTLGGCMVWRKGSTLSPDDGAGHVAIVEQINADGSIITSESGWGGPVFTTRPRAMGSGNWGAGSGYTYRGCIRNPAVSSGGKEPESPASASHSTQVSAVSNLTQIPVLRRGSVGEPVKALQILLNGRGFSCGAADGIFGGNTAAAVEAAQNAFNLVPDQVAGPMTFGALLGIV